MPQHPTRPTSVAVVGSGVAGLVAAYIASGTTRVTLYEADPRLGGHADTHRVPVGPPGAEGSQELAIDTGFIVHNQRTYPTLLRVFRELGVATQESEMSLSVRCDDTGIEWAGALGRRGLFPDRSMLRADHLRMLTEIPRFHRMARRLLDETSATDAAADLETLAAFVARGRFTERFRTHFLEPLIAAVWSSDPEHALEYPARYLFTFLDHHGMLGVFGSPTWRTVSGGSHTYVDRIAAALEARGGTIRTGTKVTSVLETPTGVEVTDGNGDVTTHDAVVLATHPHQALAMLAEPTAVQREVLGAMAYSPNTAQLHTDASILPTLPDARASWNYLRRPAGSAPVDGAVTVTYDLTRLMRLPEETRDGRPLPHYLVTLGGTDLVDPATVIDTMEYEHPIYTPESVAAQQRLPECDSARVVLAGAYHGWGFHEDGARSGAHAAERLGLPWVVDQAATAGGTTVAGPETPAVYATTVRHTRRRPWQRTFTHTSHTWLVDLDALPRPTGRGRRLRGFVQGTFEARDHLGDPDRSLRANVEDFLDLHQIALERDGRRGRVLMAAQPRAFGYCFNPISVFWCLDGAGETAAVVVEVHNTYGDRHAYLVHPDEQGRARTDKAMYVSPFHGTDGHYDLALPLPTTGTSAEPGRLRVAVTLRTSADGPDGGAVFSASLDGVHHRTHPVSPLRAAPAALRGSLLIRLHGVWLWLRRLPIRPRPEHHQTQTSKEARA